MDHSAWITWAYFIGRALLGGQTCCTLCCKKGFAGRAGLLFLFYPGPSSHSSFSLVGHRQCFGRDGFACHLGLRLFRAGCLGIRCTTRRLDTLLCILFAVFLRMNRDRSWGRVACERCCHFCLDSLVRYPLYIPPLLFLIAP